MLMGKDVAIVTIFVYTSASKLTLALYPSEGNLCRGVMNDARAQINERPGRHE
jgi:hypothetical protein